MKKTIKDIPYETCTVCGGYEPVGKFGSGVQTICIHCLNGGKLAGMKPIVKEKLPGRNDACPCGSGLKFKKCYIPIQSEII